MVKNRKIINIFKTAVLLMALSLLLIFNGCTDSDSNNIDTATQEDISSDASGVSQESSNETTATENESKDADDTGEETNQDGSSQSSDSSEEQDNSLKGIYERFIKSGKPSILIFSYDADCCPGTKAFFEEYNTKAMNLTKSYSGVFNTLFINTGILDKDNMNTVTELAVKYEVLNLPSILILDVSGQSHVVIDGEFNEDEVKKILDGMKND